jgi:hypothetical protein
MSDTKEHIRKILDESLGVIAEHGDNVEVGGTDEVAAEIAQMIDAGKAEIVRLKQEVSDLEYAAHMPEDYRYGLPSWICQRLYAAYIHQARNQKEWDALKRALDQRDALRAALEDVYEDAKDTADGWEISKETLEKVERALDK